MRLAARLPRALVLALVLSAVPVANALAYYSAPGSGTGAATTPTIVGPANVAVSQSGANLTVSWSAASLTSGLAVQGYRVTRSGATTVCGSPTLVTTLSCTDSSVPPGTYTYTVTAIYNSWDAAATSASFTVLTSPTISGSPPSLSNNNTASFSFSGGGGSGYQCQLDGGAYSACTSPASYSGLGQGSHTFAVRAASGGSSGPTTSYGWTVDTVPPSQTIALASGASSAYLTGTTLYYNGSVAGSFKLVDPVTDSGSGPASATFPAISTGGWTHPAETVSTPSGGPYTSSTFSWTSNPQSPGAYTVTGADVAGNTTPTTLTLVSDTTPPTGGALTVNGTAASATGSTSQASNSTAFTIGSRSDYTDSDSGLTSSVLTVQSESLSGSNCGAPGSGGPFASPATISGTTQPSGVQAGYCYLYTLTGTDNVGNIARVSTTVVDNTVSFRVTTQPTSLTAGLAAGNTVVLTAIKNGAADVSYTGATLTWSGASNSPVGTAPTLPTAPTWIGGQATFGIALVKAESETLTVTDGTRSVTLTPITVSAGAAADVAWTGVSSPAGVPSPCLFTCTYASGFGNSQTWSATISITDTQGNVVDNIGAGHTVLVTTAATNKGATTPATPATIAIPSSGPATSATTLQYTSVAHGNYTDTLTAASVGDTSATASFTR